MSQNVQKLNIKITEGDQPDHFKDDVIQIINRILSKPAVLGILYFVHDHVYINTVPGSMRRSLKTFLPRLSPSIYRAITEIDVLDDLVAYRLETNTFEILVSGGKEVGAVVVQQIASKKKHKKNFFLRND